MPHISPSPPQLPSWDRFKVSTKPFRKLYEQVTASLLAYAAILPGGVTGADYTWFKYLVDGFESEYQKWATNPHMRYYLERTDQLSRAGRLTLYAYLHIAYDLPRVIADSFLQSNVPPRARCKQIFAKADFTLLRAFYNCGRMPSVLGRYSICTKCFYAVRRSWYDSVAFAFGSRFLVLRNDAWDTAEKLASSTISERQITEENIWHFVEEHTSTIVGLTKNARKILIHLRSPRVCMALPILIIVFDYWLFYLILGFFVLGLTGGISLFIGYRRFLSNTESFGREIHKGMRSIRASLNKKITKSDPIEAEIINFCIGDETIQLSKIESMIIKLQNPPEPKTFEPEETIDLEVYDKKNRTEEKSE